MADFDKQSEQGLPSTPPWQPANVRSEALSGTANEERDRKSTRFLILAMLFFVTGFLGLPVLWISKSFSLTEKIAWSILNTIYTCALIAGTVAICVWALRPFFSAVVF